jgi:hypothetical protein
MKLVLQQLPNVKGEARSSYLSQEAAFSLVLVEQDAGGLFYKDMWRDATASLLNRRFRKYDPLPGYDPHNYGISVELDIRTSIKPKKLAYEDLIKLMERRNWYCQRRDAPNCGIAEPWATQFNYLGKEHEKYLSKATQAEDTWMSPTEHYIWERYSEYFLLGTIDVQYMLSTIGFYKGKLTGERDPYTREAIMAFQRAWEINQSGMPDMTLCRVLSLVTAELKIL